MVALVRVHGLRCSKVSASYSARCQPQHIVAGVRYHWSREERCFQCKRFSRAWFILAASARAQRCALRTERNGGFGFQAKVKDRFLNQRRWTCWYSCRENMQVLSVTVSLVWLFGKVFYLCCAYLTLRYGGFLCCCFFIYLIPQCLLNIL